MPRLSGFVALAFQAYQLVLFARVLMSWFRLRRGTFLADRVAPTVYRWTEPLLTPIRRALRPYQGGTPVDFSPLVLFFILAVVEAIVVRVLMTVGL